VPFIRDRFAALRFGRTPRLLILAALVGIGAGLGAVILIQGIQLIGDVASWVTDRTPGGAGVLLALPVGMVLAWRFTSWFAPEVAGHGVPQIVAAIALRGGAIRTRVIALKTVATALTIGAGGSAGREGSIAQIGSAIGSWLARAAKLGENDVAALVAAGAGAGISATFNAPIAGMFFAMEIVLREFSLRHLNTVVIASVAGAVVAHSALGDELTFTVQPYALDDPRQLVLFAVLGLVTVAFAWLFLASLDWFEIRPIPAPAWLRPVLFGLLVAVFGFFRSEILGTGQHFVNSVLRDEVHLGWWTLIVLAVMKAVATGATLGGRGSGGIFMPSLFIGATAGSAFARLTSSVWGFSTITPGSFALVGMAATFSAVARAPFTSILIVFEITGDYGLVLPLMIATTISTVLAGWVRPDSAYTAPLTRKGIHPTRRNVTDLLDTVAVKDTMRPDPVTVESSATLGEVQGVMQRNRVHGAAVLDDGRLVGIVTESDIARTGGASDQASAADAMTPHPVTVTPDTPVSDALERMAALGVGRLPIVDRADPEQLLGMFVRGDVVSAYHQALGARSIAVSAPGRQVARTGADAGFFEVQLPPGSVAHGRTVSEVPWPEGCLVVSIHRGSSLLVPSGSTPLQPGDALTVFGSPEARERLVERLSPRATVEEPPSRQAPAEGWAGSDFEP